jgi:hypothetical protein
MALALSTKQWIWILNAFEEVSVQLTNITMFCHDQPVINIVYNHKIGNRSKHIAVAHHVVHKNIESGWISVLQVESTENGDNICTKGPPQVTLWKCRAAIMDAK